MKRKLILLTISLLLLSMILSACGDKAITGLQIKGLENGITVGTTPDFSGVSATVTYNDDTSIEVTAADLTFSTISTDKVGTQKLTVTYKDYSVTIDVKITEKEVAPPKPVSMEILASSVKTDVIIGEAPDTSAIKAIVTYDDASTVTVSTGLTVGTVDTSTAGEKTLTVTWGDLTATLKITVHGIERIEVDGDSVDTTVEEGETVDVSNLKVYAVYSNDHRVLLDNAALEIIQPDTAAEGEKFLVIKYGELEKRLPVSSVPPTLESIKTNKNTYPATVIIGDTYVCDGITVTATYSNHTTKQITVAGGLIVSAVNTETAGNAKLTVTFGEQSDSVTVTVLGVQSIVIDKSTVNGGDTQIVAGEDFDLSGVSAIVTFSDNSKKTVTLEDGLVLGELDTETAGNKTLTATYKGVSASIAVIVEVKLDYTIVGTVLPETIPQFNANYKNPNLFRDVEATPVYKVGDDNPFRLTLTLKALSATMQQVNITSYVSTSRVYLVEGNSETLLEGDALAAMVAINEAAGHNSFDFTEAAIDKTFRLETRPLYGVDGKETDATKSLTVLVVDAYNIYTAKELNLITNTNSRDLPAFGAAKPQLDMVNEFLANNSITRPEKLSGVVLHCDLNVTVDDIPAGYLVSYNDAGTPTKGFYDHLSVFIHALDSANPTFTLYGNYFTINSKTLPIVCKNGFGGNDDDYSSSELFRFETSEAERAAKGLSFDHNNYKTRLENVLLWGDDPTSNNVEDNPKNMLGLIAIKTRLNDMTLYNVGVQRHLIALLPDYDNQNVTIEKARFFNSWQSHLYVWSDNMVQSDLGDGANRDPEGYYSYYAPIKITIKDSELTKCGGPVIIVDNDDTDKAYNKRSGAQITVDTKSVLYSYVAGTEAWFVANNMVALANQIKQLDYPISQTAAAYGVTAGITTLKNPGLENTQSCNLIYALRGNGSNNGSFKIEGTIDQDLSYLNDPSTMIGQFNAATGGQAPIIESSGGGTAFITDTGIQNHSPELFRGDYLSLYYAGLGIVVGYYH